MQGQNAASIVQSRVIKPALFALMDTVEFVTSAVLMNYTLMQLP